MKIVPMPARRARDEIYVRDLKQLAQYELAAPVAVDECRHDLLLRDFLHGLRYVRALDGYDVLNTAL